MSLKKTAVSGVKWTTVSAAVASIMQLIQIAILARFLDKDAFGLMAMALFVIGISQIFIDMGISNAIIHKQEVNKKQLSTLYWLNIFIGIVIFLFVIGISPLVAYLYDTPELKPVIMWIAVSFLILPWGQQFDTLLRKDMKFKSLALRDVLAKSAGLVISVVLAYLGYGVYALVFANLASAIASVVLLTIIGVKYYRPRFVFSIKSLKNQGFFSFGLYQMGEKIINYFNSNFDTILIGKILGMESLGLYNIAKQLVMKPFQILNPIITKVAFPTFAKVQNDTLRLKNMYLKVIRLLSSANSPIYILMILLAKPIILLFFGSDWIEAVPIFQVLAVGTLFISIGNPVGSLQLAKGRADWGFYWNLGMLAIMPLTIWSGSFYGLIGIAVALAVFYIIGTYILSWKLFILPLTQSKYVEYIWSFSKPILLSIISAILPYLILNFISSLNIYIELIVGILIYGLCYSILSLYFNRKLILEGLDSLNIRIPSFMKQDLQNNKI